MPHTLIQFSGPRDAALAERAVRTVDALTLSVLGKSPEVMATVVRFVSAEDWFIGGTALSASGGRAFHLEISITDETNTKAEKARYLREVFDAFSRLAPDLHEVSYVHLVDARAAAYGYGGRTQEWRHQRAGA